MGKLVLLSTSKHLYRDDTACAFITYGTMNDPRDHLGNSLIKSDPFKFEHHLQNTVVPLLAKYLSGYRVTGTDLLQGESCPKITISRIDCKNLTGDDLKKIHEALSLAINVINANKSAQNNGKVSSEHPECEVTTRHKIC